MLTSDTKRRMMQFYDLVREKEEVSRRIDKLELNIKTLEEDLRRMMDSHETVKDKVYGGFGGEQGFVIEGFPQREFDGKREALTRKRQRLLQQELIENELLIRIEGQLSEIMAYRNAIEDSQVRRIFEYRVISGLKWADVAKKMGHPDGEESYRKVLSRFFEE